MSKEKVSAPHTLMELSIKQIKRCKGNSISLKGLYETEKSTDMKSCSMYKKATYGDALLHNKHVKKNICKSNGITMRWKSPMLRNIKGGFFIIVADKEEVLNINSDVIILDGSGQCNGTLDENYQPSGKVLLLVARLQARKKLSEYSWGATFLKKCKDSVVKKIEITSDLQGNITALVIRLILQLLTTQALHSMPPRSLVKKSEPK